MKAPGLMLLLIAIFLMASCSESDNSKVPKDNVWKEQTDTIDKAKEVKGILKKSAEEQAKAIEKQMQ